MVTCEARCAVLEHRRSARLEQNVGRTSPSQSSPSLPLLCLRQVDLNREKEDEKILSSHDGTDNQMTMEPGRIRELLPTPVCFVVTVYLLKERYESTWFTDMYVVHK